ncbi:MAG: aldo/keto reductase [Eubacteriales bacterium]|nr:aldo/keto reductase [Eubacteriales bacterium]
MVYRTEFNGMSMSSLGFGTMRLPLVPGGKGKDIDQEKVDEMVAYALEHGVKYFDTAAPYHESYSEVSIGKALAKYPRNSFCLADKYPGHQIMSSYNPKETFEEQLEKCGVEYFDFYLLHNVNENSLPTYLDEKWGIHDYFVEQKKLGRIKHLGFSCHGDVPCMEKFLGVYGDAMEFCQIQLNYLDWTLQDAKAKYEYLTNRGLGVWVMEPVRGGKLASLPEEDTEKLRSLRPDESIPAWAFRFLQGLPNVRMILSGMSSLEQMKDNVKTFEERKPLNDEETAAVFEIAEKLKNAVPCTGCRYCCKGCPAQLDIPSIIRLYNDAKFYLSINVGMKRDALGESGKPENCIGCGQCAQMCPQGIDVPALMPVMKEVLDKVPVWAEVCKEREEAAKKSRGIQQ